MTSAALLIEFKAQAALLISRWSCSGPGSGEEAKSLQKSLRRVRGETLSAACLFFPYLKCHPSSCVTPPWGEVRKYQGGAINPGLTAQSVCMWKTFPSHTVLIILLHSCEFHIFFKKMSPEGRRFNLIIFDLCFIHT